MLAVDLKDDASTIAAYVEHHRKVWPEVQRSLRAAGIQDIEILLLGRRLVMIVETERELRDAFRAHEASNPRVVEWEALMRSMQDPLPGRDTGEWWAVMQPIFRLNAAERCAS